MWYLVPRDALEVMWVTISVSVSTDLTDVTLVGEDIEVTSVINILYGGREEGVHPPSTSIDTLVTGMVKGIDFAGMQPEMPQQISPLF